MKAKRRTVAVRAICPVYACPWRAGRTGNGKFVHAMAAAHVESSHPGTDQLYMRYEVAS